MAWPIFLITRNPEEDSKLPYLVQLPIEGGLVLKARDTWPRAARIYCHPFEGPWPEGAEVIEEAPALSCKRRGPVIDLVLDRPRLARSQFVFTEVRGRPAIFWQTQKAARAASPGARIPPCPSATLKPQDLHRHQGALPLQVRRTRRRGRVGGSPGRGLRRGARRGSDRRRRAEDPREPRGLALRRLHGLPDATAGGGPKAAVVIEGRYSALFRLEHVPPTFIADGLARLQVRYPEIQVVFADSRRFAEEWTYRFLAAALSDA